MAEKKPTKEEIEKQREGKRKAALANLNPQNSQSTLVDLAVVYSINNSKAYGEAIEAPVEQILFKNNIGSGAVNDLIHEGFNNSRQGGKRYTGTVSEYGLLEQANEIVMSSIYQLKVSDIMSLTGLEGNLKKEYKNKYLNELDKKEIQEIAGRYLGYLVQDRLQKVIAITKEMTQGGLEQLLCAEKKEE